MLLILQEFSVVSVIGLLVLTPLFSYKRALTPDRNLGLTHLVGNRLHDTTNPRPGLLGFASWVGSTGF